MFLTQTDQVAQHKSVYSSQQLVNHSLIPLSFWQWKREQQKTKERELHGSF